MISFVNNAQFVVHCCGATDTPICLTDSVVVNKSFLRWRGKLVIVGGRLLYRGIAVRSNDPRRRNEMK